MLRVIKPLNFLAVSPSRAQVCVLASASPPWYIRGAPDDIRLACGEQVSSQAALEVIPLVMEPQSGVYTEPVAVLDFQSLYPSMIIAYNLCFSTCLGKLDTIKAGAGKGQTRASLGVLPYSQERTSEALASIERAVSEAEALSCYVAPSGAIFCGRRVREGVLPRMLHEILETRFMIKRAMKRPEYKSQSVLLRVLNARQFALKMIANVTYGYTSATFSGRMPMAELADAIVATGRRTLELGVQHVQQPDAPWAPARVVYGDTDSMFVRLEGRGTDDAIRAGQAIGRAVSAVNPHGVVLKFEKVYSTSVMVSKKRYVGMAHEDVGATPHFDAKGIEVVRRDQCPLTVKIQEKALRILFNTRDLSLVSRLALSLVDQTVAA
jgi:DNA polymerase zeta